jgi:hypothetical protein
MSTHAAMEYATCDTRYEIACSVAGRSSNTAGFCMACSFPSRR